MARRKLQQFADFAAFSNTYTPHEDGKIPITHWNTRNLPITLELASGTGAYTVEMARRNPDKFFIGIDIKGSRMWTGANIALQENLTNVLFIRMQIEQLMDIFSEDSLSDIWITFADPFLPEGKERKRLTFKRFLKMYLKCMKADGNLHLKTDSIELFEYSKESITSYEEEGQHPFVLTQVIENVYTEEDVPEILTSIQTTYELSHLKDGRTIRYLRAEKNNT